MGANCGEHCKATSRFGGCVLRVHGGDVHVWGTPNCESGNRVRYVDQATADMYPACGSDGVMTAEEIAEALAESEAAAKTMDRIRASLPRRFTVSASTTLGELGRLLSARHLALTVFVTDGLPESTAIFHAAISMPEAGDGLPAIVGEGDGYTLPSAIENAFRNYDETPRQ